MTAGDALTLGLSPDAAPPGGDLRPGGVAPGHVVVEDRSPLDAAITPESPPESVPAPPAIAAVNPFEAMVRAIEAVREELAGRDAELRDALVRIARLYERLATTHETAASTPVAPPITPPALAPPAPAPSGADEEALRTLLRSIDTLATVTEASITRASDLSRSMQHLVEAVQGLTNRVDSLVGRTDTTDVRIESIAHTVDALSDQVTMLGRRLSAPAPPPRPKLRAIGRDDAGSSA